MIEPRSTATIRALAGLAELSANQLEEGASIEDVIQTLRKAAEAVRLVVDDIDDDEFVSEDADLEQDLTPMELIVSNSDDSDASEQTDEEPVLNAG